MTPIECAELRQIGERILALANGQEGHDWEDQIDPLLAAAQREIKRRQSRSQVVPSQLLGEPAWDILLDLYVARMTETAVSMTSACIASGSPQTTGLRYIAAMVEDGLIIKESDPTDGRRVYVRLSNEGHCMVATAMRKSLDAETLASKSRKSRSRSTDQKDDELTARHTGTSQPSVKMHRTNLRGELR